MCFVFSVGSVHWRTDTKLVLRFEYQVSRLKPQAGKRIEQLKQHVG